eukprot:g3527.t1
MERPKVTNGPPPGFEHHVVEENVKPDSVVTTSSPPLSDKPDAKSADALAAELETLDVKNDVDTPDELYHSGPSALTEIHTETDGSTLYTSASRFEDLKLSESLLQGLYTEMNFERPSAIQAKTLPMILTPPYKHLVAQAQNGSGKTTCFVLSMLSRANPELQETQSICVCPTRELVLQNLSVAKKMAKFTSLTFTSTTDSTVRGPIKQHVLFGTHGKLKGFFQRRWLSLDNIKVLVFDEADNMLELAGFADDSFRLVRDAKRASREVQILLFSATYNDTIREFSLKLTGDNPNFVFLPKEQLSLDVIKQYKVEVPSRQDKYDVLSQKIFPNCEKLGQTIIFVRSRNYARILHQKLTAEGHTCTAISGEMLHEDRDRVVQEFRDSVTRILISTDVLSRGFDVSDVTLVVNYDLPVDHETQEPAYETYLHRIGRSGRFGRNGCAFNLIFGEQDRQAISKIETYFDRDIPPVPYDDEDKFIEVLKKADLTEG